MPGTGLHAQQKLAASPLDVPPNVAVKSEALIPNQRTCEGDTARSLQVPRPIGHRRGGLPLSSGVDFLHGQHQGLRALKVAVFTHMMNLVAVIEFNDKNIIVRVGRAGDCLAAGMGLHGYPT